jgi:hypothetical protein
MYAAVLHAGDRTRDPHLVRALGLEVTRIHLRPELRGGEEVMYNNY